MKTRTIKGEKFYLLSSHATKTEASYNAQTFRKSNKKVRVIPFSEGFNVYAS
jgi:hypothetical protein